MNRVCFFLVSVKASTTIKRASCEDHPYEGSHRRVFIFTRTILRRNLTLGQVAYSASKMHGSETFSTLFGDAQIWKPFTSDHLSTFLKKGSNVSMAG